MKYLISIIILSLVLFSCSKKDDDSSTTTTTTTASDNGTTFSVTVCPSRYYIIDGILTKSLTLKKGYTYFFDSTDSTTNHHPLFIGINSIGGSYTYEYTSGVTNSRTTTETLTFIVPSDSPSPLYYNCGNHEAMGGKITIL